MFKPYIRFALALALSATAVAYAQNFSVLYNFGSESGDPINPQVYGSIAQGRDGNFYSTTPANLYGTVFKITPRGTLTVPYRFDEPNSNPFSGLTLGTDGNFYGTTSFGGSYGFGSVFRVTPGGSLTTLYSFPDTGPGVYPQAPPIEGSDGNFYGTALPATIADYGTIYKITPSGKFTTLYSFDDTHGSYPYAPLVQATDGNFYGTASGGGAHGLGVVYKITASGKLTVIYNLDQTHGGNAGSPLVQGNDGSFYGTTQLHGSKGYGAVFKVTPTGKLTVLHNFDAAEGSTVAGLVQATDGNFYGTTGSTPDGTIFRISSKKPYAYKVLYSFDGTTGNYPAVVILQHTNGILYGDTEGGGTGSVSPCSPGVCGVFYSLNIGAEPFVRLVSTSGKVGKTVEILGQGFKETTAVSFNGTPATFKVLSSTYLTAEVPSGSTTGFVTVTTPKRKLKSNTKFRVIT